jgi:hypothetical protein
MWETILVAVLTSGTMTGLLVAVVKAWMESRIKLEHEARLTMLKAELEQQHAEQLARLTDELRRDTERQQALLKAEQDRISYEANELFKVRLQSFPKLSELVYRIRNIVRDIRDDPPRDLGGLEALSTLVKDFDARLYEFRLPLEHAGVFLAVHEYKRHLQTFLLTAKGLASWFQDSGDNEEGLRLRREIDDLYGEIDRLHQHIIGELVVLVFGRAITSDK